MSTITAILTAPDTVGSHTPETSIGVVIDNKIVAWGSCRGETDSPSPHNLLIHHRENLLPLLQAIPVLNFRQVSERLQEIELPRALRFGLSTALLYALSRQEKLTPVEILRAAYGSKTAVSPPPLYTEFTHTEQASILSRHPAVRAVGYSVPNRHPEILLGSNGSRLQQTVRALREQTSRQHDVPILHLRLHGGLGRLFDNALGKMLGALYGLERAAEPCRLQISDPVLLDDPAAHWREMEALRQSVRWRKLKMDIVAGAHVTTPGDVAAAAVANAADMVQIVLEKSGSIHHGLLAIAAAQEHDLKVLLSARDPHLLAHVALAAQPDLVHARLTPEGDFPVYTEMERGAAWLQWCQGNV